MSIVPQENQIEGKFIQHLNQTSPFASRHQKMQKKCSVGWYDDEEDIIFAKTRQENAENQTLALGDCDNYNSSMNLI